MRTLGLNPPSSFAGSSDKTAAQFWTLATEVGQSLMDMHKWQVLNNTLTITIVGGTSTYDLPSDFNGFVSDADWNRSRGTAVIGSLEEFEWQELAAVVGNGSTINLMFRVKDDQVEFRGLPTAGQQIVMPYNSRGWVKTAGGVYKDNLELDDDVILLDPTLFKVALRRMWMDVKQFDTTKVEREYMRALLFAKSKDKPGRTLSLAPATSTEDFGINNPIG